MSGTFSSTGEPVDPDEAMRHEIAHLHEAVKSQREIGVAIGLVAARYGCTTDAAWRTMLRISQDSNTKVRLMAHALVAAHDGTPADADCALLQTLATQLPASGWPPGARTGNDLAP